MPTDELLAALDALPTEELPAELEKRVHALARSELAPVESRSAVPLRLALSGALVPSLLVSAAAVHTAETVQVASSIYAAEGEE